VPAAISYTKLVAPVAALEVLYLAKRPILCFIDTGDSFYVDAKRSDIAFISS
jgi:hypothetical protein